MIATPTAGPYVATSEIDRFHGGEYIRQEAAPHSLIAVVADFNRYDRDDERKANARLLAGSWELMDICAAMVAALVYSQFPDSRNLDEVLAGLRQRGPGSLAERAILALGRINGVPR